jgi:glutathione S-transferase
VSKAASLARLLVSGRLPLTRSNDTPEFIMKLYYAAGACSLAVHIALRETAVPFEPVAVDLATHTMAGDANYYDVSPRGYVPLLEMDDGSRHTEVAALLQYVADRAPGQALIGAVGSDRRLQVTQWLAFVATELHKTFSPWLFSKETAGTTRQAVIDKLNKRFSDLDRLLATRSFLAGDYSVADAYAFTIVSWAKLLALPLTPYPHLSAYLARVAERPRVQEALRAEGLLK